jgi:hypothetical protein
MTKQTGFWLDVIGLASLFAIVAFGIWWLQ